MKPSIYEPMLMHEQPMLYLPQGGTDVIGCGIGPEWTRSGAGVVSHPTPTAGFTTQFRRTRITSAASIDNELGVHQPNVCAWRGNATSRGGFFFKARFLVNAIPNTAVRLFAGLSAQTATGVCISNTVPANTVGLWCDAGDSGSLSVVTCNNAASATKNALAAAHTITAGVLYEFLMICNPSQSIIVTQLNNVGTGAVIASQNVAATMPDNATFMAPQVGLSNAANAAGGDTVFDVYAIYLRPNLRLTPLGTP